MGFQEYNNILVGMDGSVQSMDAFKKAVEVARRNNAKIYVANIIDQQFYNVMGYGSLNQNMIDSEAETAKELIKECETYAHSVNFENVEGIVAFGSAKEVMAHDLPEKHQIDLVIVGQSGLNALERVMTGSVSSYIIREAPCDVLIVSHEETKE
ncbi:MAG: universal stress protein [Enterococcus sp.]